MNRLINNLLLQIVKRAEKQDESHLVATFVDIGPLFTLLKHAENQVIFGRRGTGKTHALFFLANKAKQDDDVSIQVDMTTLGSTGGIYSDQNIPLTERATRLLIDTLSRIHECFYKYIIDNSDSHDLSVAGPLLDKFIDSISEVRVEGEVEKEELVTKRENKSVTTTGQIEMSLESMGLNFGTQDSTTTEDGIEQRSRRKGIENHRVHFGRVFVTLSNLCDFFLPKKCWILLDEWSEIPLDIQPFLADLLRRTLFPIKNCIVKIAAIEQRSAFRITTQNMGIIGFQAGADIEASLNLDEYMVFDNNADKAKEFFSKLFLKHITAISGSTGQPIDLRDEQEFIHVAFTQMNTFDELVRASEGVPRDAINILCIAAQKAGDDKISVEHIRYAAKTWYNRAKEREIATRPEAMRLLHWLIDEVIGNRRSRAFLLRSDIRDRLIDFLFDARVLHIVKESVSAHDQPGIRFKVYSIDYGCYVDLISTSKAPLGLFQTDKEGEVEYINVPVNDYRSIRRAILDINRFYGRLDVTESVSESSA